MSLGNLVENIYNGNISLDAAKKIKKEKGKRKLENMLQDFINYNPVEDTYKNQKTMFF